MDTTNNVRTRFIKIVGGKNFMTPQHIKTEQIGKYAVEISTGSGMLSNKPLFGVTVTNLTTKIHEHDLCKCCYSMKEVQEHLDYIRSLK